MQFALVEQTRSQPQPGLRGNCTVCGQSAISKCGPQRLWHWSHCGRRHCDPWWENETDWHRAWKSNFPEAMREVVHFDQVTGEKHVADVKTIGGLVIELQHSAMSLQELQSREAFYGHMIWIVDGRPFAKQFEVLADPLPHPKSALLQDVVFFPDMASTFWRRSEAIPGSSLVEMHRANEIEEKIRFDYRGHHFFRWKRPREVWRQAKTPVFIDFGGTHIFRMANYNSASQWCVQRISKVALIEKNGGMYVPFRENG
jgi:competence protein CoiA